MLRINYIFMNSFLFYAWFWLPLQNDRLEYTSLFKSIIDMCYCVRCLCIFFRIFNAFLFLIDFDQRCRPSKTRIPKKINGSKNLLLGCRCRWRRATCIFIRRRTIVQTHTHIQTVRPRAIKTSSQFQLGEHWTCKKCNFQHISISIQNWNWMAAKWCKQNKQMHQANARKWNEFKNFRYIYVCLCMCVGKCLMVVCSVTDVLLLLLLQLTSLRCKKV